MRRNKQSTVQKYIVRAAHGTLLHLRKIVRAPSIQVIFATCVSLTLSLLSVWLLGTLSNDPPIALGLLIIFAFVLSYLLPAIVLAFLLFRSFQQQQHRSTQLRLILVSYFSMIV